VRIVVLLLLLCLLLRLSLGLGLGLLLLLKSTKLGRYLHISCLHGSYMLRRHAAGGHSGLETHLHGMGVSLLLEHALLLL
jgi:hypothetical protein